jgi:hypothetical protein
VAFRLINCLPAARETAVANLRNGQLTPSGPCHGQSLASYAPLGPHGWFSGGNNTVSFAFPSFLLVFRFRQETAPHHRTTHENGRLEWHPPSPGPQKWCWGVPMRYSGAFLRRSGCVSRHMYHLTGKPSIATGHDPQTPPQTRETHPSPSPMPLPAALYNLPTSSSTRFSAFSGGRPPFLGFGGPLWWRKISDQLLSPGYMYSSNRLQVFSPGK